MPVQVFDIARSENGAWLSFVLVVPLALLLLFTVLFWPRKLSVEIGSEAVVLRGSIYGRSIAWGELDWEHVRLVDLRREPVLAPVRRTNGVGLPSYRVGWFRLADGQRALCFLTTPEQVVYLPTHVGYVVLASVSDAPRFIDALRATASAAPRAARADAAPALRGD